MPTTNIRFYGTAFFHVWLLLENRLFGEGWGEKDHFDNCLGGIMFGGV